jgi:hypothetical protein
MLKVPCGNIDPSNTGGLTFPCLHINIDHMRVKDSLTWQNYKEQGVKGNTDTGNDYLRYP